MDEITSPPSPNLVTTPLPQGQNQCPTEMNMLKPITKSQHIPKIICDEVHKFSFQYIHSLKSGKRGTFITKTKKSLSLPGVCQPNNREKGIFSVLEIKHVYPLRQGVQCTGSLSLFTFQSLVEHRLL